MRKRYGTKRPAPMWTKRSVTQNTLLQSMKISYIGKKNDGQPSHGKEMAYKFKGNPASPGTKHRQAHTFARPRKSGYKNALRAIYGLIKAAKPEDDIF